MQKINFYQRRHLGLKSSPNWSKHHIVTVLYLKMIVHYCHCNLNFHCSNSASFSSFSAQVSYWKLSWYLIWLSVVKTLHNNWWCTVVGILHHCTTGQWPESVILPLVTKLSSVTGTGAGQFSRQRQVLITRLQHRTM